MVKGIPASKGFGIGKAVLYKEAEDYTRFAGQKANASEAENSLERFRNALTATADVFEDTRVKAAKILGEKEVQVFEAYKMVLEDPIFNEMVQTNIQDRQLSAEASVLDAVDQIRSMFLAIDNEYMKQRAEDIENVGKYVLDALLGRKRVDLSQLEEDSILLAKDLTPADTVALDREHIKGFAIEKGGMTSHTAIVARTLEIPAVVGCGGHILDIPEGTLIILDGESGTVIPDPGAIELEKYFSMLESYKAETGRINAMRSETACTPDGRRVELTGNITLPEEAASVLEKGGDGIGLFRTEFLYLGRSQPPTEEEQFQAYKKAAETMGDKPCIIRTMDIGGDKKLKYLGSPAEENPFLGYRAIRISLEEVAIFKTQLRAILRAGVYGNLQVMFPMISGVEELRSARRIMAEVMEELDGAGIPFDRDIKAGIMIEIPSAAMIADVLAKEADFFSIGTNDLCQYTLAVDRMNEKISRLYNPLHPGVLRLIRRIIDAGHEAGIKVGMCGEMASDPESAAVLVGMGLDEFSMVPSAIPHIKKTVRSLSYEKAKEIAENALKMESAGAISDYIKGRLYA